MSNLKIKLHHVKNCDIRSGGYWEEPKDPSRMVVEVNTLEEASDALRAWCERNGLGSGNMASDCGDVIEDGTKLVAHVSFNGRVWEPGNYPTKEIRIGGRLLAVEQFGSLIMKPQANGGAS